MGDVISYYEIMKKKIFFLSILIIFFSVTVHAKQSDLDGTWYSSTPRILKAEINDYAEDAKPDKVEGKIVGAIVPHAGIRFSGPIAVYSYKVLQELNPETVVIVGFTHNAIMPGTVSVFGLDKIMMITKTTIMAIIQ